jgi:hypothetical protein
LSRRWIRDSSYFCKNATTAEFRFEGGGGTPIEELVRTYQENFVRYDALGD